MYFEDSPPSRQRPFQLAGNFSGNLLQNKAPAQLSGSKMEEEAEPKYLDCLGSTQNALPEVVDCLGLNQKMGRSILKTVKTCTF